MAQQTVDTGDTPNQGRTKINANDAELYTLVKNRLTLASDVATTATSFSDVTGLTFSVTSGTNYRFHALLIFDSAATTTGANFAVNGPASPTLLGFQRFLSFATGTGLAAEFMSAYDTGQVQTGHKLTGNICVLEGMIRPSSSGTFALRFASEVSGSAITVKAGSVLEWW